MLRGLGAFALIVVLLGGAVQACTPPAARSPQEDVVAVQATTVRRTAVAEVQRIIANNPQPTSTPPATPRPQPGCAGAIWWYEARGHIGETRAVQGQVVATRPAPGGAALLELGQPYPDPTGIGVLVPGAPSAGLDGQMVCATGRITSSDGLPTLQVRDRSMILVVGQAP